MLLIGCNEPTSPSILSSISSAPAQTPLESSDPLPNISKTTIPAQTISETPAPQGLETIASTPKSQAVHLFLSPVPKLGETGELTIKWTRYTDYLDYGQPRAGLAHARAWVEFGWTDIHGSFSEAKKTQQVPASEVVVNGDSTWEGKAGSQFEFKCKIKFPREGIWVVSGIFTGEGWSSTESGFICVALADGMAMDYYGKDFKSGPLAYLSYFTYGGVNYPLEVLLTEDRPVLMDLDIDKAPKVGEEAIITCTINSLYDVDDFKTQISFDHRTADTIQVQIPGDDFLVDGNLRWQGDLKKGSPITLRATIKFPEEGDWNIGIRGNSLEREKQLKDGYGNVMRVSIAADRGCFGWPDRPTPAGGFKYVPVYPRVKPPPPYSSSSK